MTFVPHTPAQRAAMLAAIGVSDFEALLRPIPPELRLKRDLNVPPATGEVGLFAEAAQLIAHNQAIPINHIFAGGGVYPHHVPSVVDELSHRGEFYTAYTPYQPEISQGMLQCIYEYQSYICLLTGMDMCNASAYDGGTALADAVLMAYYHAKGKKNRVLFAAHVLPEARAVVQTYVTGQRMQLEDCPMTDDGRTSATALNAALDSGVAAVVFQLPQCLGYVEDNLAELIDIVHKAGAVAIVSFYPYAAGLLKPPGELGADIVCGEAQCLGNHMGFGGPLLGYLACREGFVRVLPGRLIGRTICERDGAPGEGFVMTLQAREQHIRRERATSNICSNEALLALRTCIYMGAVGRDGFIENAQICHANACLAHDLLCQLPGVEDFYNGRQFFNEFTLRFPAGTRDKVYEHALGRGMLAGIKPDNRCLPSLSEALVFAFTEVHREADIRALTACIKEVL
jgi:glycine dehydrogenase subunit 1